MQNLIIEKLYHFFPVLDYMSEILEYNSLKNHKFRCRTTVDLVFGCGFLFMNRGEAIILSTFGFFQTNCAPSFA